VVFFHGGGFTIGSLTSHDPACRLLAASSGCMVAAVDYRLSPENPFPTPIEDCLAAYNWLVEHAAELGINQERVAVCGDSAGGTISAVLCQLLRGRGGPCLQALIYPATDLGCSCASHRTFAHGFPLDQGTLRFFLDNYLPPGQDPLDPRASPLFAEDLRGLPRALVVTAGHDMLRDEGRLYVQRLREAGVEVRHIEYAAQAHGFINATGVVPAARQALEEIAREMGRTLNVVGVAARS